MSTENQERSWTWVGNFDGDADKLQSLANDYDAEVRTGAPQPGPEFMWHARTKLVGEVPAAALGDKLFGVYIKLEDWVEWFLKRNPSFDRSAAYRVAFPPIRQI